MAEQAHFGREQPLPLSSSRWCIQMLYSAMYWPALRFRLRDAPGSRRRESRLEKRCRQAHLGPLPPRPRRPSVEALVERREREVQQHDEGELVLEEIVRDVRRRIVAADDFVEGKHRAEIEVQLLTELAVDLYACARQAVPAAAPERLNIVSSVAWSPAKFDRTKSSNARRVAILRAPEFGDLVQASLDSRPLRVSISWPPVRLPALWRNLSPTKATLGDR